MLPPLSSKMNKIGIYHCLNKLSYLDRYRQIADDYEQALKLYRLLEYFPERSLPYAAAVLDRFGERALYVQYLATTSGLH